jgi:hypothetical protein
MTVSDRYRARFEGIGLPRIRRELTVGSAAFLGNNEDTRRQAREWVEEKLEEERREKASARRWTVARGIAGFIAAVAACIAAWPIVRSWF